MKLYFYSVTSYVLYLERLYVSCFCFCLNKYLCGGETRSAGSYEHMCSQLLMFMVKVETASLIVIWLELENATCSNCYNVLDNVILGNCCAHV